MTEAELHVAVGIALSLEQEAHTDFKTKFAPPNEWGRHSEEYRTRAMLDVALARLVRHDTRVTELLSANTRQVEERRQYKLEWDRAALERDAAWAAPDDWRRRCAGAEQQVEICGKKLDLLFAQLEETQKDRDKYKTLYEAAKWAIENRKPGV